MNTKLVSRLRCKYPTGPIMESGEPEFGYRDFSGEMLVTLPSAIMLEAADEIEALRKALQELYDLSAPESDKTQLLWTAAMVEARELLK